MPAVRKVLVIGAGLAGTASAIRLAQSGVSVDIVDKQTDVTALGSGITLQGNALRALRELGVWEQAEKLGYSYDSLGLRAPDPNGTLIVELDEMRTGGPDLPATAGMYRPDLARPSDGRAIEAGAQPRLGVAPTSLARTTTASMWIFTDGTSGRYDLVIGADGVRSWTRQAIGIDVQTTPTGMGIWRVFTDRPESVTRTDLYYGGPSYIAGYCPTGPDTLYAYVVEKAQDRFSLTAGGEIVRHPRTRRRLPRAVGRDPRFDHRRQRGELHVVRNPCRTGAVEPRPGRDHRGRSSRLPADGGPGRCAGTGGRPGAHRVAARTQHA